MRYTAIYTNLNHWRRKKKPIQNSKGHEKLLLGVLAAFKYSCGHESRYIGPEAGLSLKKGPITALMSVRFFEAPFLAK